jgi:hypothetical protein
MIYEDTSHTKIFDTNYCTRNGCPPVGQITVIEVLKIGKVQGSPRKLQRDLVIRTRVSRSRPCWTPAVVELSTAAPRLLFGYFRRPLAESVWNGNDPNRENESLGDSRVLWKQFFNLCLPSGLPAPIQVHEVSRVAGLAFLSLIICDNGRFNCTRRTSPNQFAVEKFQWRLPFSFDRDDFA